MKSKHREELNSGLYSFRYKIYSNKMINMSNWYVKLFEMDPIIGTFAQYINTV